MSDPLPTLIHESFLSGMADFRAHIDAHWPSTQAADLDESNLTLHLARHLATRGVLVYTEVWAASVNGYLDLFAIDLTNGWALALESKRLKDGAAAKRLGEQIDAMGRLVLPHESRRRPRPTGVRCFVGGMAHVWGDRRTRRSPIVEWWQAGEARPPVPATSKPSVASWSALHGFLARADVGTFDLTVEDPHWALFAVAGGPPDGFWGAASPASRGGS